MFGIAATDGCALFEHLRPGQWTCNVRDTKLPDGHYVEHPEKKLELLPGDRQDVAVRILARQRTIQFIDGGVVK